MTILITGAPATSAPTDERVAAAYPKRVAAVDPARFRPPWGNGLSIRFDFTDPRAAGRLGPRRADFLLRPAAVKGSPELYLALGRGRRGRVGT